MRTVVIKLIFFALPIMSRGATYPDIAFSNRISLATADLTTCLSRFLEYPPGPGKLGFPRCVFENPFPENPKFWLRGIDFSCVSPWNDSFGCLRAGTAISKRHIVFANHFPLSKGERIAFVGEFGETSHYTLKNTKAIHNTDIMVGLLDYELTPDIHPARILHDNFQKSLPIGTKWPVVTFNQKEQAFLSELSCHSNNETGVVQVRNLGTVNNTWRKFKGMMISGDSGNPAFLIYRGQAILLYCLLRGGDGYGPMIHCHKQEVQQAMDDLCPGYRLEAVDLQQLRESN